MIWGEAMYPRFAETGSRCKRVRVRRHRPRRLDPHPDSYKTDTTTSSSYPCNSVGLAADQVRSLNALGRIPRIHDKLRLLHNLRVVIVRMVGYDQHAVVLLEMVQRSGGHVEVVMTPAPHRRMVGIVVEDFGPLRAE